MALSTWFVLLASCAGLVLLAGVLLRACLAVVTVESGSMLPTLLPGDRVLVVRHWPATWLHKGQVVLVVLPGGSKARALGLFPSTPFVKRIIGLGGETITAALNDGVDTVEWHQHASSNQSTWHVPEGYIFVRGDNGPGSLDSLVWGPISVKTVVGLVLMKLPRRAYASLPDVHLSAECLTAGYDAPPFATQTISGEPVTLESYLGHQVLFLFLTPRAIQRFGLLIPKAAEAGITLVFVSDGEREVTRAHADELGRDVSILIAPRATSSFLKDYQVSLTPAYCFLNEHGKVLSSGVIDFRSEVVRELLEGGACEAPAVSDEPPTGLKTKFEIPEKGRVCTD